MSDSETRGVCTSASMHDMDVLETSLVPPADHLNMDTNSPAVLNTSDGKSALDLTLSSALTILSSHREDIHLAFSNLVPTLNLTDWGPIKPCLTELFNLLLTFAEIVFQPASASDLSLQARIPLAIKLRSKITSLEGFLSKPPSFTAFFLLSLQITNSMPRFLAAPTAKYLAFEKESLPSTIVCQSKFCFPSAGSNTDVFSFDNVLPPVPVSQPELLVDSAESNPTCLDPPPVVTAIPLDQTINPTGEVVSEPLVQDTSRKFSDSIFVKPTGDWKVFITAIHSILKTPPTVKYHGELAKFTVYSQDDFDALKNHLSVGVIENAALTPLDLRPRKVVIKGLPASARCEDIASELEQLGFHTPQLVNMRHRLTKVPMPLFLADVTPSKNFESIFSVKTLLYLSVNISIFTSKRPRQCYNCQRYGHSSLVCNFAPRCVKCAGEHQTSTCLKPSNTPAKCALCGADHTANFRGCPLHPDNRHIKRSAPKNGPKPTPTSINPTSQTLNVPVKITPSLATSDSPALAPSSNWGSHAPSKKRKKKAPPSHPSDPIIDTCTPPPKSAKLSAPAAASFPSFNADSSELAHDAGVFFSVMAEIRELCSEFNMSDLLTLLKCTKSEMSKHSGVSERFTVLFTAIFSFFGANSFMAPVPCEQMA